MNSEVKLADQSPIPGPVSTSMRVLRWSMALIPFLVLFLAGHFLHSFFLQHPFSVVWDGVQKIPQEQLISAVLLTFISYGILSGYDLLGLMYLKRHLKWPHVISTSFMAFGFNNNLGMAGFAGSSIRYHNYSRWGLSVGEVLKIIMVVSFSFWIGFLTVGGVSLTLHPLNLTGLIDLPDWITQSLGLLLLVQVIIYLGFLALRKKPYLFRGAEFRVPRFRFGVAQVGLSSLDWVLVASVLYTLLPPDVGLTFMGFLAIFCLSQIVAVFTHVPGGIGVLEAMLLHFLTKPGESVASGREAEIMAALIVFRIIYYFIPLLLALVVLAMTEIGKIIRGPTSTFVVYKKEPGA